MTRDPYRHLFRRWRQTGLNVGTGLNSTNHCRKILFEGYEVLPAKQDCRAGTLSGLDHQDFIEVYQNLSCRRSRSFQCDENGQSGLPFSLALPRSIPYSLAIVSNAANSFAVQIDF